jgi:hypothetical protein
MRRRGWCGVLVACSVPVMTKASRPPWLSGPAAQVAVRRLADAQEQVVSRGQLIGARVPRWVVRMHLRAGRWQRCGQQTLATHNGPLPVAARQWVAVLEVGPRAALDGVTALQAAGATGLDDEEIHVIVPRGADPRCCPGVVVHESRRFREQDVVRVGVRRTVPAVAAVHAALWARSERQAQLFLLLCVQQRLATVGQVSTVVRDVKRHRHRVALLQLVTDLADGVQSLGELDVAGDLRRRGLPEPDRQVLRRRASGVQYLDCRFTGYGLVLEIDGAGHDAPAQRAADVLRDLDLAADGDSVVRIPLVAYRLERERVLDGVEHVLRTRGWAPRGAA